MFNCVCVDIDDDCRVEAISCRVVKARKAHICGECKEPIRPGEQYEYEVCTCDGEFQTYKTCLTCLRVRKDFLTCGWYYGYMWADIHQANCVGEDDNFCMCPEKAKKQPFWN